MSLGGMIFGRTQVLAPVGSAYGCSMARTAHPPGGVSPGHQRGPLRDNRDWRRECQWHDFHNHPEWHADDATQTRDGAPSPWQLSSFRKRSNQENKTKSSGDFPHYLAEGFKSVTRLPSWAASSHNRRIYVMTKKISEWQKMALLAVGISASLVSVASAAAPVLYERH